MRNMLFVNSLLHALRTIIIVLMYLYPIHSAPMSISDLQSPDITLQEIKDLLLRTDIHPQEKGAIKSVIEQTKMPTGRTSPLIEEETTTTSSDTATSRKEETTAINNMKDTHSTDQHPREVTTQRNAGIGKTTTETNTGGTEVSVNKQSDGKVEVKIENQINIDTKPDEKPDENMVNKPPDLSQKKVINQLTKIVNDGLCEVLNLCGKPSPW